MTCLMHMYREVPLILSLTPTVECGCPQKGSLARAEQQTFHSSQPIVLGYTLRMGL